MTHADLLLASSLAVPLAMLAACLSRRVRSRMPAVLALAPLYFLFASLVGLVLGRVAQGLVRGTELDRRFGSLHFGNDWHYLFNGEIRSDVPRPDAVVVAATVEHAGQAYLYVGYLRDYAVDRDGELKRLHLNSVVRRRMTDGCTSPLSTGANSHCVARSAQTRHSRRRRGDNCMKTRCCACDALNAAKR